MRGAIRIRRAEEGDAQALSVLAEKTFRDAFAAANTDANMQLHCVKYYGKVLQLAEIADPNRETWVAESAERLIAFAQLRLNEPSPWVSGAQPMEIQRFYVDVSRHGSGLAHQLMRHVLERAKADGSATLWLGVWERNPRAVAFYQKWGFEVVGDHIFKVGEDPQRDLIMRRDPRSGDRGGE